MEILTPETGITVGLALSLVAAVGYIVRISGKVEEVNAKHCVHETRIQSLEANIGATKEDIAVIKEQLKSICKSIDDLTGEIRKIVDKLLK